MKTTQNSKVLFTAQAAMIAAIYVVLTVIGASFAFGPVQVRLSEALTILPVFTPAAVPGVFLGCLISNVIAGGTAAGHHLRKPRHADRRRLYMAAPE